MRPRVILHNAVSVDGHVTGFPAEVGLYYDLARRWRPDAHLVGSRTILAMEGEAAALEADPGAAPAPSDAGPDDDTRPLLVVPDSRGYIRHWAGLRAMPHWRPPPVALCSETTPDPHRTRLERLGVATITVGADRVDLAAALEILNQRYGVATVQVDSGGLLNGALLRAGLVDEISLLVHPWLVGGLSPRTVARVDAPLTGQGPLALRLCGCETLENDLLWLRYEVRR